MRKIGIQQIEDIALGASLLGAGGGGFLRVILKKGVSEDKVQTRLKEVFQDNDVQVWHSTLV